VGWGGKQQQSQNENADEEGAGGTLNEEQRKELYRAIDWDEKEAVAHNVDMPKEAMLLRVKAKLETGSFALRSGSMNGQDNDSNGHARKAQQHDLISLNFDDFQAGFVQRPENFDATLALGGFRVFDGTCEGSVHTQIVKVKQRKVAQREAKIRASSLPPPEEREADEDFGQYDEEIGSDAARGLSSDDEDQDEDESAVAVPDPFFSLKFEHQPIDERADNALSVRLRHMEIIYSRGYVEAIFRFFKPPESQLESVGALIDVASSTLEGIRKETRAGLEYALQQHKTVDVQLDLNAVSPSYDLSRDSQ
jgi:vacuolar protein sorting-associated protein 13A/C